MRIPYLIKQTFAGISRSWGYNLILIVTIASSFLVINSFLLITHNLKDVAQKLRGEVQIEVYLNEDTSPQQINSLAESLQKFPEVERVEFRSKEEAFTQLESYLGKELLEGIDSNPLPASFLISLKKEHGGFQQIAYVASRVQHQKGVEDVEFGGEWLKKLDQVIFVSYVVDIIFGILIALAVTLIVSNFMRVMVVSQVESIQVMNLLGASQKDIFLPLLIQGMILSGLGAILGLLLVWAGYLIFSIRIITITFLSWYMILGLVIWGMILGAGGSFLSIRKHLQARL